MSFLADLERRSGAVRDTVRAALENGTTMRVTAARTWLDAGRPVSAAEELSIGEAGIIEYVPGDLTITVLAGTPLDEIRATTAANRQWLALDPFGRSDATIGATVATVSAGPLAHAFGTPRDQVIGLGFVTGKGDYVRSGGRVVKNVAGFDLTRLLIGSWGTLGVITDVTLRLRAMPEVDTTIALVLSDEITRFRGTMEAIAGAPLAPYALELLNAAAARAVGLDGNAVLLARLAGNTAAVAGQRETLGTLGEIIDLDTAVWERLRETEAAEAAVARFSGALADFVALWRRAERELADSEPLLHATPGRGAVRCIVSAAAGAALARFAAGDEIVRRNFERLPADVWPLVASPANDRLSRRVREAYDPAMLLNPGILGQTLP